jgi:copper chaperone
MMKKTFQIVNMLIEEDQRIVENALQQMTGVKRVEAHYPSKHVTIEWQEPATWDDIERTLHKLGYPAKQEV